MKRFVVLFITVFVCCSGMVSCGTQKNFSVSQETKARHDQAWTDSSSVRLDVESMVKRIMDETVSRLILQDIEIERVLLSDPDSAGRQHITERTNTRINTSIDESGTTTSREMSVTSGRKDSTGIFSGLTSAEESVAADSKTRTGMNWWQKALMWSGAAALVLVAIRIALKFVKI